MAQDFRDLSSVAQNAIVDAAIGARIGSDDLPDEVKDEIREWATPPVDVAATVCWLRDEAGGPMGQNPEHVFTCNQLAKAAKLIEELASVVKHCWIHSGFRDCGRDQMSRRQKDIYDSVTATPS